jgi:hypothetical protein
MGETDAPEQRRSKEALRPLAVPIGFYEEPLHACIYHTWLKNEELPLIQDAVVPLLETMSPKELLAFGEHIENAYIKTDLGHAVDSIWPPDVKAVDEAGLVSGAFGHITQVTNFFRDTKLAGTILDCIEQDVFDNTFYATEQWQGIAFANQQRELIQSEIARRVERDIQEQPPAQWIDIAKQ